MYTPREIVSELDRYIIGQDEAKKAVAVALRNRWRRAHVPEHLREEIAPKNIIMIGPTGVGKTEIARRLARIAQAPFVKVEATKYTEVGYVGKDVESMIRDLTELGVKMVTEEEKEKVMIKAEALAEERLLDILLPGGQERTGFAAGEVEVAQEEHNRTREKLRRLLREGKLDEREVEVEARPRSIPMAQMFSASGGMEEMSIQLGDMFGNLFQKGGQKRKVKLREAREMIIAEEAEKLLDKDEIIRVAIERTEEHGIVFLDEIDKVAGREGGQGPDVSREGVQRDILPLVEGSNVTTKYGNVRTDHVLFIASGAFHVSRPSDLIPELQGRFPIRVELKALTQEDFVRILLEPRNALKKQYEALMETEGIELKFTDDAIQRIADIAFRVNESTENIGARRLHTVLERVLEDLSFNAPDMPEKSVVIDAAYVDDKLSGLAGDEDLSRYIL